MTQLDPKVNPEHMEVVRGLCNDTPYLKLLGMDMTKLEPGYCRIDLDVDRKHYNPFGGFCGGAYASLMDIAAYWCLYGNLDTDDGATTLDLQSNYLRAVTDGHLVCEGYVTKIGRSICLCKAEIHDEKGRLVANSTSKMFLAPGIQPISQCVDAIAPGTELPPKFLD